MTPTANATGQETLRGLEGAPGVSHSATATGGPEAATIESPDGKVYDFEHPPSGATSIMVINPDGSEYPLPYTVRRYQSDPSIRRFYWGYETGAPLDTAYNLLLDCVGENIAERYYEGFHSRFTARMSGSFILDEATIKAWLRKQGVIT